MNSITVGLDGRRMKGDFRKSHLHQDLLVFGTPPAPHTPQYLPVSLLPPTPLHPPTAPRAPPAIGNDTLPVVAD